MVLAKASRPDVKVVDATLRDGGLVNNFYFTDEFVKALYLANLRAGVDYMEFGYKASTEMLPVSGYPSCSPSYRPPASGLPSRRSPPTSL